MTLPAILLPVRANCSLTLAQIAKSGILGGMRRADGFLMFQACDANASIVIHPFGCYSVRFVSTRYGYASTHEE